MDVTLLGMVTEVKLLQLWKAYPSMDVTLLGMVTDVSPLQPSKAEPPMEKEKERLLQAGMDIPEVYKLADALRAKGLRLPYEITDAKLLLAEVKRRKGLK